MAVKLRLRRMGRKKRPFYRIIAADSRAPRDGRFIEEIGYYNPLSDPITLQVSEERALYWLGCGAIPTTTVKNLLRQKGITLRFDLMKQGVGEEKIEEEMKKWEVLQIEKERRRAQREEEQQKEKAKKAKEKDQEEEEKESVAKDESTRKTKETAEEPEKTAEQTEQAPEPVEEDKKKSTETDATSSDDAQEKTEKE